MYGAMREHAPSSTRFTGAISAAAITLAMGYALATGMGNYIVAAMPDPIVYVPLPETKPSDPPPATDRLEVTNDTNLLPIPPLTVLDTFVIDNPPITGESDPPLRAAPGPSTTGAASPPKAPVRVSPKMLPAASPAYPASEVRKGNQGISALEVCLDARGRVSSAALAASSGHPVLDNAALKWVRDLKFTPAKLDGTAQSICGHSVIYEWKLDRR